MRTQSGHLHFLGHDSTVPVGMWANARITNAPHVGRGPTVSVKGSVIQAEAVTIIVSVEGDPQSLPTAAGYL